MLPFYQRQHRNYDRFLPHLAKYLEPGLAVIDVGANCGDSLAGMFDVNPRLNYICIEPDDVFFDCLLKNVSRLKTVFPAASIHTVKTLAGKNVKNASLEGTAGTKHAVINGGGMSSQPIDDIVFKIPNAFVRLLKTDTDGFDYDVIESSEKVLELMKPLVFFECQHEKEFQKIEFVKMISWLESKGYNHWTLFDNFGGLVLRTGSTQEVFQLLDYVWRQNIGRTTRTLYYFDILASAEKDEAFVNKIVTDFVR